MSVLGSLLSLALAGQSAGAAIVDADIALPIAGREGAGATPGFEPGSTASDAFLSVPLPEGKYRVTLRIGGKAPASTTVKAEARRLVLRNVTTRKGQTVERSFLVDVRRPGLPPPAANAAANAPSNAEVRLDARDRAERTWDNRLTLEFSGAPAVSHLRIEPVQAPTIYIVGDSTVADQYAEPFASWGQMLPAMLDDTVLVSNHAKSGASLKSFLVGLRLDKVLAGIRPGDWLLIQFGHNDQKADWPQTYVDPQWTYPAYLRTYIAEARRRGAVPVLVTSPERRNFDADGRITDTLGAYSDAVRKVGAEEQVPVLDLNRASIAIYQALGPRRAPEAFAMDGKDRTHHDNYGAWLMAAAIATELRGKVPELAGHVIAAPFDPARPPPSKDVAIVPSRTQDTPPPAGN